MCNESGSRLAEKVLYDLFRKEKLELDSSGCLKTTKHVKPDFDSLCNECLMDDYFNIDSDIVLQKPLLSIDEHSLDFGQCSLGQVIPPKSINITNHATGKMLCSWVGDSDHPFYVNPQSKTIEADDVVSFSINFKPKANHQVYYAELECYIMYEIQKDLHYVEPRFTSPPTCITLKCIGTTFISHQESFIPDFILNPHKVVFPGVILKEAVYRTIYFENIGSLPILFEVENDSDFSVKPSSGVLVKGHQIFVIRFLPQKLGFYSKKLKIKLNKNPLHDLILELYGTAEEASISFQSEKVIYFKPTAVGYSSVQNYTINNMSRLQVQFEWKMSHIDPKILQVNPNYGILEPYERRQQSWCFKPQADVRYLLKPVLHVFGQSCGRKRFGTQKHYTIRVFGEGHQGQLKSNVSEINFGNVFIKTEAVQTFHIENICLCNFSISLSIHQNIIKEENGERHNKAAFTIEPKVFLLVARTKKQITITVKPKSHGLYNFSISYVLWDPEECQPISSEVLLCTCTMNVPYPLLYVKDATVVGINKRRLWTLFSIDVLNDHLAENPQHDELNYEWSIKSRLSHECPVSFHEMVDFNFSAAPLGSNPAIVTLLFENIGIMPCKWHFIFPNEFDFEIGHWAQKGDFTPEEIQQMLILDNNLFQVEPRKGIIQPGENQMILFRYYHLYNGTHQLPVVLRIMHGRQILINFVGITIEPHRRYIHFGHHWHTFASVPIGELLPPIQTYELYNGSALPVNYSFDLSPLVTLNANNFNHEILHCLNPKGNIPPGKTTYVNWIFSPLECKTYEVDILINVHEEKQYSITFSGTGYNNLTRNEITQGVAIKDSYDMKQHVCLPGQVVFLSQERLTFTNLPLFSSKRRLIFIKNKSPCNIMSFHWTVTNKTEAKYIQVEPEKEFLLPNETKLCKITFYSHDQPALYNLDLICEMTNMTEMDHYEQAIKKWEIDMEERQHLFTISESNLNIAEKSEEKSFDSSSSEEFISIPRNAQLLPPLKISKMLDTYPTQIPKKKVQKSFLIRPQMPEVFTSQLAIMAQTYTMNNFREIFPDEVSQFFIDRIKAEGINQISTEDYINCNVIESKIIEDSLKDIIGSLMVINEFKSIMESANEVVPYFCQFREELFPKRKWKISKSTMSRGASIPEVILEELEEMQDVGSPMNKVSFCDVFSLEDSKSFVNQAISNFMYSQDGRIYKESRKCMEEISENDFRRLPEVGNIVEEVLENTIYNIIQEAMKGNIVLTVKPKQVSS